jgi:hypothetical protein
MVNHGLLRLLLSRLQVASVLQLLKNLQNMHAKSLPPTGARGRLELEYQDWARLQLEGRGPHTGGPKDRLVGWRMWWSFRDGQ